MILTCSVSSSEFCFWRTHLGAVLCHLRAVPPDEMAVDDSTAVRPLCHQWKDKRRVDGQCRQPTSSNPDFLDSGNAMDQDFTKILEGRYPWATEELDQDLPEPLIDEISITCFVDSDFGHDTQTRRSIFGILIFVGRTPIFWSSKRQGAIATSTYSAEFFAMGAAIEEVQNMRYMLRSFGIRVEYATPVLGDN